MPQKWNRPRVITFVVATGLVPLPIALSAQEPIGGNCNAAGTGTTPFSIAASGGISKGAYQAGALWAILQVERQRRASGSAAPTLASLAGASAGNVNGLLMAAEWATPLRGAGTTNARNERASLLWRTWTGVGIDALLPEKPEGLLVNSLLDPEAFNGAKDDVRAATRQPYLRCQIPMGITMTRSSSVGRYVVRNLREVVIQRYASVNKFVSSNDGFEIVPLQQTELRRGAGATIVAPLEPSGRRIVVDSFLNHVQASAAFPFAFPPVRISFRPFEGALPTAECTAGGPRVADAKCTALQSDIFLDGGVFDNNPLALARDLVVPASPTTEKPLNIWLVSPGQRRGPMAKVTPREETDSTLGPPFFGVLKFISFGFSVIGAAADYELFTLERRLQGDNVECGAADPSKNVCLLPSTRYFPIYGAAANSFGAFLGKPLREIDFYVGIYDGVAASMENGPCANPNSRAAVDSNCVRDRVKAAITSPTALPELSVEGREIVNALWSREHDPAFKPGPNESSDRRVLKLLSLLDALWAEEQKLAKLKPTEKDPSCAGLSAEVSMFCADGLRAALIVHGKSPYKGSTQALDKEQDERRFNDLLDSFDGNVFRIVRPLVLRQWQVESGTQEKRYLTRALAKIGQYVVAYDEEQYRRGFEWDPSSVPDYTNEGFRWWPHFLPYSVEAWEGHARASWSPSLLAPPGWELGLGPSVVRTTPIFASGKSWSYGGGLRVRTPGFWQGKIYAVALDGQWDCMKDGCGNRSIVSVAGTLGRRFKVGYIWNYGASGLKDGAWTFGTNDFAGLTHLVWWKK